MFNIVLCSGFSSVSAKLKVEKVLPPAWSKIGFIPNAADTYEKVDGDYPYWVLSDIEALKFLWYHVIMVDLNVIEKDNLEDILNWLDGLLVWGGNVFWLLSLMRKLWLVELIQLFVKQGKWYIGSSAWSCIMSPDIAYIQFADDPSVSDLWSNYVWLGLVSFGINPHFSGNNLPESDIKLYTFAYERDLFPIITLQNDQAIVADLDWTMKFVL